MDNRWIGLAFIAFLGFSAFSNAVSWPTNWMFLANDTDDVSCGNMDVLTAYGQIDSEYLYLRLNTQTAPNANPSGNSCDAIYKWFIDLNGDGYVQGQAIHNAEYVLAVRENAPPSSIPEIYLIPTTPQCPSGSLNWASYRITNSTIANWSITGNYLDMAIKLTSINNTGAKTLWWVIDKSPNNICQQPSSQSGQVDWPDQGGGQGPFIQIPGITFTKDVTPTFSMPNGNVTFTLFVNNTGTTPLNLTVNDTLPPGLSYVNGSANYTPLLWINNSILWYFQNISNGSFVAITFNATVDSGAQASNVTNYATAFGEYGASNVSANASTVLQINPAPTPAPTPTPTPTPTATPTPTLTPKRLPRRLLHLNRP